MRIWEFKFGMKRKENTKEKKAIYLHKTLLYRKVFLALKERKQSHAWTEKYVLFTHIPFIHFRANQMADDQYRWWLANKSFLGWNLVNPLFKNQSLLVRLMRADRNNLYLSRLILLCF